MTSKLNSLYKQNGLKDEHFFIVVVTLDQLKFPGFFLQTNCITAKTLK